MSTVTPDQGIVLPAGTDLADVVAAMTSQTTGLESRGFLRYASAADRTARHPVGIEGERCDLADVGRGDAYDGANWISDVHRGYATRVRRAADAAAINNSAVLVSDAVLLAPLEINSRVSFGGRIYYDASTVADFKLAFTWPAGVTVPRWGMVSRNAGTNTNIDMLTTNASGTALAAGGVGVGTVTFVDFEGTLTVGGTAGNLQAQYAQNTAEATNMTVRQGSDLWVIREA